MKEQESFRSRFTLKELRKLELPANRHKCPLCGGKGYKKKNSSSYTVEHTKYCQLGFEIELIMLRTTLNW